MQNYAAQDEILYHVGLSREMLKGAEYALLPGDPGRVEALAKALGPAQYLNTHREYTSWLAVVEGQNVLVCSTGMGGPSVAIGLEELGSPWHQKLYPRRHNRLYSGKYQPWRRYY